MLALEDLQSFPFHKGQQGQKQAPNQDTPKAECVYWYKFRTDKGFKYVVNAAEYPGAFFAVKFYPWSFKDSDKKFNALTDQRKARRVINTVFKITHDVMQRFPQASFVFLGSPTEKEMERGEDCRRETIRHRIYKNYAFFFIGDDNFKHVHDQVNSIYVLVNKTNEEAAKLSPEELSNQMEPYIETSLNLCAVEQ